MLKVIEYGKENHDVILLLHGGGLSWWNYREAAELLQEDYHVVLPILDGHAQSERDFTSIEDNASELIAYIEQQFGGSVLLLGGLSLGAQIVVEMLSQRANVCQYAIVESALVLPMKLIGRLIEPLISMSYGLIQQDWFSVLQFQTLGINKTLSTAYVRDTREITRANMISFLKANAGYRIKSQVGCTKAKVFIFAGQQELPRMLRSAYVLNEKIANSVIEIKKKMKHGDFSINHAAEYVETINNITRS